MQDLLTWVKWDDTLVRADVRGFDMARLGDPQAVLIVDETGVDCCRWSWSFPCAHRRSST
jgi:hypothetical protein